MYQAHSSTISCIGRGGSQLAFVSHVLLNRMPPKGSLTSVGELGTVVCHKAGYRIYVRLSTTCACVGPTRKSRKAAAEDLRAIQAAPSREDVPAIVQGLHAAAAAVTTASVKASVEGGQGVRPSRRQGALTDEAEDAERSSCCVGGKRRQINPTPSSSTPLGSGCAFGDGCEHVSDVVMATARKHAGENSSEEKNSSSSEKGTKERTESGDGAEHGEDDAFDEEDCLAKIEELVAQKDYAGAAALEATRCERNGVVAKQDKGKGMDKGRGKVKGKIWDEGKGKGRGKGKDLARAMRSIGTKK